MVEFRPEAIGKSTNDVFVLENPDLKYYSLMILAQETETDTFDIASCIHAVFGGYLNSRGEYYLISSDEDDSVIL